MSKSATWIKSTLKLPKTTFPPRPPAKAAERAILLQECSDDLYAWQRANRRNAQTFTLHDGPPYANGDLHIGHALNKVLKDITNRYQLAQGRRIHYVPGWDCHGLPIELKALEKRAHQLRCSDGGNGAKGTRKVGGTEKEENAVSKALSVRKLAMNLASTTIEKQKKQFQSWGVMADWDNAWKTMDKDFEIKQLEVFRKMVSKGLIYRNFKPVYWSPSTRTALAEAELEYRDDHSSTAAFVRYPLMTILGPLKEKIEGLWPISCVIWTTMPWTIPANRAIGFNPEIEYTIVQSHEAGNLLLSKDSAAQTVEQHGLTISNMVTIKGSDLCGASYSDSLWTEGAVERPLIPAYHVLADSGTGLAHLAPGHGPEDYQVCLMHGIKPFAPVGEDGAFNDLACHHNPKMLSGKEVMHEGNEEVLRHVTNKGMLLKQHDYIHRYPYDWRSKKPVILRATAQWFANVGDLQQRAIKALEQPQLTFTPQSGQNRLASFVKNRSEWCISRQRAWGVPIPALFHAETGQVQMTEETISHIINVIRVRNINAWWSDPEHEAEWTPPSLREADGSTKFRRGTDTMDVWFDSGSSWTQAINEDGFPKPADVFFEGTDQHRGWFQSSLLTYVANQTHGIKGGPSVAPFRGLVTHGFVLDQHGRKMSKSEGNVIAPAEVIDGSLLPLVQKKIKGKTTEFRDAMGPDALRLWVASCDFSKDVTLSPDKLKLINGTLAKLRVIFKQLLGLLHEVQSMDELLPNNRCRIAANHFIATIDLLEMQASVAKHYENLDYHMAVDTIVKYVNVELSAFYLETVKDAAYCGDNNARTQVQTTVVVILDGLIRVLAPILPLLAQEVWQHLPAHIAASVPERPFEGLPQCQAIIQKYSESSLFEDLKTDLPHLMSLIADVKKIQEEARNDKTMGSSLECGVTFVHEHVGDLNKMALMPAADLLYRYSHGLADLLIVSHVNIVRKGTMEKTVGLSQMNNEKRYTKDIRLLGDPLTIQVYRPLDAKCVRCWRYVVPPGPSQENALCQRCHTIIDRLTLSPSRNHS